MVWGMLHSNLVYIMIYLEDVGWVTKMEIVILKLLILLFAW